MDLRDKKAFAISSILVLVAIAGMIEGGAESLGFALIIIVVALYWVYRYLNKDISFINKP
jgi:hypothetical protein